MSYVEVDTAESRRIDALDQIGRNDPCWCGSGKKFKKCHGTGTSAATASDDDLGRWSAPLSESSLVEAGSMPPSLVLVPDPPPAEKRALAIADASPDDATGRKVDFDAVVFAVLLSLLGGGELGWITAAGDLTWGALLFVLLPIAALWIMLMDLSIPMSVRTLWREVWAWEGRGKTVSTFPRLSAAQRNAVAEWAQILGLLVMLLMALREFRVL